VPALPVPPAPSSDHPQAFCGPREFLRQPPGRRSGEGSVTALAHMQHDCQRQPSAVHPGYTFRGEPRPEA
jgi:hypothetical protein